MRFWIIAHESGDLYFADCPPDRVWTLDELFALRFSCEDAALTYIVSNLGGRGRAVEIVMPTTAQPSMALH